MSDNQHVYPTRAEHNTNGKECWCKPRYAKPCDDCEDGDGCWKCDGGLIDISREEADIADGGILIIHNDVNVADSDLPVLPP